METIYLDNYISTPTIVTEDQINLYKSGKIASAINSKMSIPLILAMQKRSSYNKVVNSFN